MSDMPKHVRIKEVGPREGFQFEKGDITLAAKISLVDALSDTGVGTIEFTSFVSPKWVPQMADAEQMVAGIKRVPGVARTRTTIVLSTPFERGGLPVEALG